MAAQDRIVNKSILPVTLLIFLLCQSSLAQTEWKVWSAPPGVVYSPVTDARMEALAVRVRGVLEPKSTPSEPLLGKLLVCAPGFWKLLEQAKFSPQIESIPTTFNPGGPGRLFRSQKPLTSLEKELRSLASQDGGYKLRRPKTQELGEFWAIIDFDITDPIIIIETPKRAILFYDGQLPWLQSY